MSQISKRKLDPKIERDLLDAFSYIIKDIKSKEDADKFLTSVLTETERLMLSKRIASAFLLKHDMEEQKIGLLLKLTNSTVSRFKLWIKTHNSGFDLIFKKLEKRSMEDYTKKILYKLLNYVIKSSFGRTPTIRL